MSPPASSFASPFAPLPSPSPSLPPPAAAAAAGVGVGKGGRPTDGKRWTIYEALAAVEALLAANESQQQSTEVMRLALIAKAFPYRLELKVGKDGKGTEAGTTAWNEAEAGWTFNEAVAYRVNNPQALMGKAKQLAKLGASFIPHRMTPSFTCT